MPAEAGTMTRQMADVVCVLRTSVRQSKDSYVYGSSETATSMVRLSAVAIKRADIPIMCPSKLAFEFSLRVSLGRASLDQPMQV